ncbi:chemotaxis protein CheW [Shewanella yunxiaonensis]|uniref:Chemotaxis protein CheW n=1 Tax=Shewanella yunxiaonensis TaxID=2829809 RepID=A0ABX7YW17_9GAMM|nr:chemotaxis protein CheW [Shewanella yunxiaonensis]QUN06877.1 chemotaxis protein CheW [Shewanella yunxiaonensis]
MPKSVDETVFDYFSVLLREPAAAEVVPAENNVATATIKAAAVVPERTAAVDTRLETKSSLDKQALQQLLAQVTTAEVSSHVVDVSALSPVETVQESQRLEIKTAVVTDIQPQASITTEPQTGSEPPKNIVPLEQLLDDEFQVLFFNVAGLTLAVPLLSLGGIVPVEHINHIIGRPRWFKGVQSYRDSQLNIVDTGAWVMPEKYDDKLAQSINYQYLVVLEDSNWGLACESLVNAVKIDKSQVNWRGKAGKRPWLAGVVKEQMCGILHVRALVEMLNAGLGCQDPIN